MIIDKYIAELICTLEYKIGKHTYNPKSYNCYTEEEGCGFKYPVNYCRNKEEYEAERLTKTKSPIEHIEPEYIGTMKYAFGSNHLYIGDGIAEVLNYLEELYGLDFNKLEQTRLKKKREMLKKTETLLCKGGSFIVDTGTNKVGLDIPAGKYIVENLKEDYSRYLSLYIFDENGDSKQHIFTDDEKVEVELEEGDYTKSYDKFSIRKS